MLRKVLAFIGVLAGIAILAITNLTSPSDAGPAVVLVLLLCVYIVAVNVCLLVMMSVWGKKMGEKMCLKYSLVIGFLPILLVGTHNFGGGWIIGIMCSLIAVSIGCVLVSRI